MRKLKKAFYMIFPLAAIAFEALPWGAVLNFGNFTPDGTVETVRKTYSYFSLTPYGYANFGPFVTAVLSCMLVLLGLAYLITGVAKGTYKVVSLAAAWVSFAPIIIGFDCYSVVGAVISLILAVNAVFAFFEERIFPQEAPEEFSAEAEEASLQEEKNEN